MEYSKQGKRNFASEFHRTYEFLAHKITTNVRELEGAFRRLSFSSLVGREISLDMVQDLLKDLLKSSQRKVNIEEIQKKVSQHFNIKVSI